MPASAPVACGAKVTLSVTLCRTPRVNGSAGPLIENPLPVVWSSERVKFEDLVFVSTTGTVELVPIATWPNDTVEGLAVANALCTPAPANASTSLELEAVLVMSIVP